MPYKIEIIEDSELMVQKLVNLLEPLKNLEITSRVSGHESEERMIINVNPDFLIVNGFLKNGFSNKILEEISLLDKKPVVIVLTDMNFSYFREKYNNIIEMHFFDKALEFQKIYDFLSERTEIPNNANSAE